MPAKSNYFFIESLGDLFKEVQLQKLFRDSKYFVDCIPRTDPGIIVAEYQKLKHEKNFDLKLFITTHFILPPEPQTEYLSANKPIVQHLNDLWVFLKRTPSVHGGTLVPLPFPYIVPGGRFREVFYWDSYFTMLGLQVSAQNDLIQSMVDNFAFMIDEFGFIPNGNRTYFLGRSQPPFFSFMVELLAEEKGDDIKFQYLPQLEKEYGFWMDGYNELSSSKKIHRRVVLLPDGSIMNRYWDDKDYARPEAFYEDTTIAKKSGRPAHVVPRNLRAACESGWDFSSRWMRDGQNNESIEAADIIPVDLNCLLLHLEEVIFKIYSHKKDISRMQFFETVIQNRKKSIQKYFWNNAEGYYFDYHFIDQEPTKKFTLAATYPLFCRVATTDQAKAIARQLDQKFLFDGGLITTLVNTGQQWDAPNGWAPLQWIAYRGLQQYGFSALANKIRERWMKNCEKVYDDTGKMMEKYNVVDVTVKAGGGKYPNQDGFGWTNGIYLKMHNDHAKEIMK
jgi:alpha,alpha-trehalase